MERAKAAKELAVAAGAIIGVIEQLVEVWKSIPFGQGPEMPADFEYLEKAAGPSWGSEPAPTYDPTNNDGDTVDWKRARELYDRAVAFLQAPAQPPLDQKRAYAPIHVGLEDLVETLPNNLRELLFQRIGRTYED